MDKKYLPYIAGAIVILLIVIFFKKIKDTVSNIIPSNPFAPSPDEVAAKKHLLTVDLLTYGYYVAMFKKYINEDIYNPSTVNPNYKVTPMGGVEAKIIAKKIYNANATLPFGVADIPFGIGDSDDSVLTELRKCRNQVHILEVVNQFYQLYKKDLGVFLSFMKSSKIILVDNYLKQLPTGIWDKVNNKEVSEL